MHLFTTRTHAVLDYLLGALLLAAPWLLGFSGEAAAVWAALGAGAALIAYSAFTQYELGLVRRIDIPVHLWLDGALGLLLAASPWLIGFDREVWVPHAAAGAVLVLAALLSDTVPGYDRRREARGSTPAR